MLEDLICLAVIAVLVAVGYAVELYKQGPPTH